MKRIYTLAIAVVAVIGLALFATPASAVHKGGPGNTLACGACHTMHNSQGNVTFGVLPNLRLLKGGASKVHNVCLTCHSGDGTGSAYNAPKVLLDVADAWDSSKGFDTVGAGGDFGPACGPTAGVNNWNCQNENSGEAAEGNALGRAHSVGTTNSVTPPGGVAIATGLTCTSCHDAHGTNTDTHPTINKYRNLLMTPIGSGGPKAGTSTDLNVDLDADGAPDNGEEYTASWKGSIAGVYTLETVNVADGIWPVTEDSTPTGSTDSNQYTDKDELSGISAFCSSCHDDWHDGNKATNWNAATSSWQRHPIAETLDKSAVDWTSYSGAADNFQLPTAHRLGYNTGYEYFGTVQADSRVFCLSCHFAHGGPYYDNLRWEHATAVSVGGDTQTSAAIPDSKGCNQCHNK